MQAAYETHKREKSIRVRRFHQTVAL